MSRIWYSDEDGMPPGLWDANLRRALRGKRGQRTLRELIAALEALPDRKLLTGGMANPTGEVCAVGAFVVHQAARRSFPTFDGREGYLSYLSAIEDDLDTMGEAEKWGMTRTLAWAIMELNDEIYGELHSAEERYEAILRWARARLIEETAA